MVGVDGSGPVAKDYPPRMGTLRIEVGDLHFSARWEPAAPATIEAIRRMLPIELAGDPLPLVGRVGLDPVR